MSSESNFSFTTKINGDLFTVRGDDYFDFINHLGTAVENIAAIVESVATIQAAGHAAPVVNVAAPAAPVTQTYDAPTVAAVPDAGPPVAPAWGAPAGIKPLCSHGPRTGRSGHGAKGEWRAYFCPTPKGTPGQCEPHWVKKGTPEWANFVEG